MADYLDVVFNLPLPAPLTYRNLPGAMAARPGVRVEAPLGSRKVTGYVIGEVEKPAIDPASVRSIFRSLDSEPLFSERNLELARWLSGMYLCSLGEALAAMIPSGKRESSLPALDTGEIAVVDHALPLTDEQTAALQRILRSRSGTTYVYGITGSGKTEVFMQAAEATLAEGRSVLYLVPEIALTGQIIDAATRRFGDRCAVLHSGLSPSKRLAQWRRILRGEADVVIGARSAIFAPLQACGLIVIDEEHESSYKSGNAPRYHARQVAMRRAATEGARLVLGSATPSVEAWHLATTGTLDRVLLRTRPAGGSLPSVEIVDMTGEGGPISRPLARAIEETKKAGGQSILFLNRRGFSWFFRCGTCGQEIRCKHCSVALTYHKERSSLECHYCGYRIPPPTACPACGSLDTGLIGYGTERVEEEIRRRFPDLRLGRLDADTVSRKGVLEASLADFRAGRIDILLGTQMVAKGLDFPSVMTIGIIHADSSLNLPDFRAAERTFALVVQVAGRAGRHRPDGRVFLQTCRPADPVILFAAAMDTEGFYSWELEQRHSLGFPPFSRLLRVVFRARDATKAAKAAEAFGSLVRARLQDGSEVLGPAPCPLGRIADTERIQVLLRGRSPAILRSATLHALSQLQPLSPVRAEIDVDPVSLL